MPIIEPGRPDLKELKGIHLWHGGMSNCSQRCRITLNELGLEFESHLMNLQAGEHATKEFQQINPNGVVPVLVHDGTVVINSVDIIDYLDSNFANGDLRPTHLDDAISASLDHAEKSQLALKYCTFEFFFQHGPRASDETFQNIINGLHNSFLRDFWHEYRHGFTRERIHDMVGRAHDDFLRLEKVLSDGREWMAGDQFSLADIAWMPNFHRFDLLRWPLELYPNLMRWFEIASARPSYSKALDGWEPRKLMDTALAALDERCTKSDGIHNYGPIKNLSHIRP
jgi:glutathione S-transferase